MFDVCSDAYRKGRPSYPPAATRHVRAYLRVTPDELVLDLGAGTGAMSTLLQDEGVRVVAVDPAATMLKGIAPRIPAVVAEVRALPFVDGSFGGGVAATSFHWFADSESIDEIWRVLRPRARLVLVWNVADTTDPLARAHQDLLEPYVGDTPSFKSMRWRSVLDAGGRFRKVGERAVANKVLFDADTFAARVLSTSFVAGLPPAEQETIERQARELVRGRSGTFTYPYSCQIFSYARIP